MEKIMERNMHSLIQLVEMEIARVSNKSYIEKLQLVLDRLLEGSETKEDNLMIAEIIKVEFACGRSNQELTELLEQLDSRQNKRFTAEEVQRAIDAGTHYLCQFCSKCLACKEIKNKTVCKVFDADLKDNP
ncbi:MAG: hypothetical protein WC823_07120 [Parcubacteria group bacterium]|jgi:hypothetical protein